MQSITPDKIPFHRDTHDNHDNDKERHPEQSIIRPNSVIHIELSIGALADF